MWKQDHRKSAQRPSGNNHRPVKLPNTKPAMPRNSSRKKNGKALLKTKAMRSPDIMRRPSGMNPGTLQSPRTSSRNLAELNPRRDADVKSRGYARGQRVLIFP